MASQSNKSNQCDCLGACRLDTCKSCYLDSLINGLNSRLKHTEEQNPIDIIDKAVVEMINYCCDIICRKGLSSVVSFDSIYAHVQKLNSEIKIIVKNVKDLKDFLCKYPHMFSIKDDKISLKNPTEFHESRLRWIKIILQLDHLEVSKSVVNALQFYSDILFYIKKKTKFPFFQLVTHRSKASEEIQIIAKNPVELKSLLAAYPQIFVVHEDSVNLTDAAIYHKSNFRWLEDLISNESPVKKQQILFKRAVDHYLGILLKVEPNYQLSISQLFQLHNVAPMDIQEVTKTKEELMFLLSNYPEVFTLKKKVVKVNTSLLKLLNKDKSLSSCGKSDSTEKIGPGMMSQAKDNVLNETVADSPLNSENKLSSKKKKDKTVSSENKDIVHEFIMKIMNQSCFIEVPLEEIMEIGPVKNKDQLKGLLSNHESLVVVDDKVILKERFCGNKEKVPHSLQNLNAADKWKYQEAKDYFKNFLLETVGVRVFIPLNEIAKSISMAPPELHKIINDVDLKALFAMYPATFCLKNDEVAYNDNIEKYKSKAFTFFLWVLREKVGVGVEFPISRLKLYMEFASFHTGINDLSQLKQFLCKYPAVFLVGYQTVTLINNFKENYISDDDKNDVEKYVGYEKLYYFESYSTTVGIEYYSRVLKRFCFNLEVPVSYLLGYRSFAPIEVFALTKNPNELKKFLSSHPDIFCIRDDKVSLSKGIVDKENEKQLFGSTENTAIQFYISVLNKVNQSNESAIVTMFGYQHLAPPEVKDLIKTPLELKDFLCKYPHAFSVKNDLVTLVKLNDRSNETNCRQQIHDQCQEGLNASSLEQNSPSGAEPLSNYGQNIHISKYDSLQPQLKNKKQAVISAIRFYSNIMFKNGPNSVHPVANLISYKGEATEEVKQIARSPTELFSFLSKFPQIFFVDNVKMTVMLTDMISFYKNQRSWIKELLPKYHQSTTNHESVVSGIQFYSNMFFEKSANCNLTIKHLFSFRKTAMEDVQSLAKNHIELKNFLSMYPEIFTVCNDCVSLTNEAFSQKNQPKWMDQIVIDCDLSFLNVDSDKDIKAVDCAESKKNRVKENDAKSMKVIEFLKSILETSPKNINFTFSKLFEYRCIATKEVQGLVETPAQLKDFCLKHPGVFTVKKDNVMLTNTKGKEKKKKNDNPQSTNPVSVVETQQVTKDCVSKDKQSGNVALGNDFWKSKYIAMKTILFYSNIICKKGLHLEHDIGSLYCFQSKAANDIKETIKNVKELKTFLTKFPQLFTVKNDKNTVAITDLVMFQKNQRSWIKELLPQNHQSTTNHETIVSTILFYSNIIFEKSTECGMPLNYLFSHRTGALDDVKAMAKNLAELKNFLATFPEIFVLDNEGVSLSDQATLHKSQPKWIFDLVCNNEIALGGTKSNQPNQINIGLGISEESEKQNMLAVRRAIQFYYKRMLSNVSNRGFTLSQLLKEAPSEVKEITSDIISLNSFLSKYPHIFTLKDGMVYLTYFNKE